MLRFEPVAADVSPARELIAAMVAEMAVLYGRIDVPGMPSATPADFAPPRGTFLVGFDAAGSPVCAGGVKPLDDGAAEIKRMYVAPAARGRGHARSCCARSRTPRATSATGSCASTPARASRTRRRCTSRPAT